MAPPPTVEIAGVSATMLAWFNLILLGASMMIYLVAFSTMGWSYTEFTDQDAFISSGLWRRCERMPIEFNSTERQSYCYSLVGIEGAAAGLYQGAQAMACLALIGLVMAIAASCIYLFLQSHRRDKRIAYIVIALCIGVACFKLLCCVFYGTGFTKDMQVRFPDEELHAVYKVTYSFGFTLFTLILTFLAGLLIVFEIRNTSDAIPA